MADTADPIQPEDAHKEQAQQPTTVEPKQAQCLEGSVEKTPASKNGGSKEGAENGTASPVVPDPCSARQNPSKSRKASTEDGKASTHSFLPINRGRVVSLDRGRDMMHTDSDDAYNSSDTTTDNEVPGHSKTQANGGSNPAANSSPDDNDEHSSGSNTSDGESSYFAKHLPSPKSGRKFSLSSTGSTRSAPARGSGFFPASNAQRESDASLSFSDDDDDWNESENAHGSKRSSMLPPMGNGTQEGVEEWQMYPHRITRMHSVSSLVSSSSDDGRGSRKTFEQDPRVGNSIAMCGSTASSDDSLDTSTSDPSVRSELRDVASSKRRSTRRSSSQNSDVPSGRKSPIPPPESDLMGADNEMIGRLFTSPPGHPQPSPPTILPGYGPIDAQRMAHPQPQPLSSEQMAAWMAAGNASAHLMQPHIFYPPVNYGATMMMPPPPPGHYPPVYFPGGPRSRASLDTRLSRSTMDSSGTLPMVYSDDDDTDDSAVYSHDLAGEARQPSSGGVPGMAFDNASNQKAGGGRRNIGEIEKRPSRNRHRKSRSRSAKKTSESGGGDASSSHGKGFRVYWQRWLMLMYMSVLNLLSDWTCYSVAPISILTSQAFGDINPELLVVVFLGANAVATAVEPIILSRLGLRRTVVFGALLLMMGSIVKSGGIPLLLQSQLVKGRDEWRIYMGFFLVGLSQPLYQCTPALLSASWFPERERTMATGVALNANQLGIGCAFIFGTLLVADKDDIPNYFGLLSIISTITFAGCLIQFEDAPPTPPSETARIIRGTLELRFSSVRDMIWRSMRSVDSSFRSEGANSRSEAGKGSTAEQEIPSASDGLEHEAPPGPENNEPTVGADHSRGVHSSRRSQGAGGAKRRSGDSSRNSGSRRSNRSASNRKSVGRSGGASSSHSQTARAGGSGSGGVSGGSSRRRQGSSSRLPASSDNGFRAGRMTTAASPSLLGENDHGARDTSEPQGVYSPSPMMPGRVGPVPPTIMDNVEASHFYDEDSLPHGSRIPNPHHTVPGVPMNAYWHAPYWQMPAQQQGQYYYPGDGYGYPPMYPPYYHDYATRSGWLNTGTVDDGAEPVLTITPHHLDIDIRDDQIILSARACFSRPGFIHALVSFTVSGIVINTLSTFMDYLVRLNGAGREYVGIVGGSFQFVIMISSLIIGKQTDKTRAYYSVTVGMLVLGAFGLAECGVSLDADRGANLRWALVVVAALVGPLQPVSTELGVDVAYPLSENTVLVIQQLFSNLLSALFIPFFKAVRDIGTENVDASDMYERPQYTFSFYLLIVLHATATVFFATFNGRYLRYEHEQEKKLRAQQEQLGLGTAFSPVGESYAHDPYEEGDVNVHTAEQQPLVSHVV